MKNLKGRKKRLSTIAVVSLVLLGSSCSELLTGGSDDGQNNYAVIVGVASYRDSSFNLSWADDDAREFFDALVRGKNWEPSRITILIDNAATKSAITSAITSTGNRMSSDDKFVFYFSGHGRFDTDQPPSDEGDGRDEYLQPTDTLRNSRANDISDDVLVALLSALPTNNVLVVLDSSFSGGFLDDLSQPGYMAMTASAANESPLEESNFLRNGVFTFYLVEGMRGPASSDGQRISAQEAFEYAEGRTRAFNPGQNPRLVDRRGRSFLLILL